MSAPVRMRYLTDSVATASPARLLVMLYDRLCLDLERAEAALTAGDREAASAALVHAQEILMELRGSLRTDAWDGAQNLAAIYTFLLTELMKANIRQEAGRVTACLDTVRPLRDTWRAAVDNQAPPADHRALA
ncbi:flagellar export chaperone FliS [Actinophytocola sp.]|uniref:flagellar export chaperone FliS n=1 Tax=Actinophytocola sp. TaxID=1872138 RepID=UPI002D7E9300|nr:flagellar export chaperone FliS [Actinophytocola sp.]HET9143750.1 flagellar export chaperone FliS [Actinophytocola sp.]